MYEQVNASDATKLYLINKKKSEADIQKHLGRNFGENGFFLDSQKLGEEEIEKIHGWIPDISKTAKLKTAEDLYNEGLFAKPYSRIYYAFLRSGLNAEDVAEEYGVKTESLKRIFLGSRTLGNDGMKKMAEILNSDFNFLQNKKISCFKVSADADTENWKEDTKDTKTLWSVDMADVQQNGRFDEIPVRINYLMAREDVTAEELAKATGVQEDSITGYLEGVTKHIRVQNSIRLAEYFHVTPGYIRYGVTSERMDILWYWLGYYMMKENIGNQEMSYLTGIEQKRMDSIISGSIVPSDYEIRGMELVLKLKSGTLPRAQLFPTGKFHDEESRRLASEKQSAEGTALSLKLKESGMKQKDLAEYIGTDYKTVSRIVLGKPRKSDLLFLDKIAKIFGMNVSKLFPEDVFKDGIETKPETAAKAPAVKAKGTDNGAENEKHPDNIMDIIWTWSKTEWNDLVNLINAYEQLRSGMTEKQGKAMAYIKDWTDEDLDRLKKDIGLMSELKEGR